MLDLQTILNHPLESIIALGFIGLCFFGNRALKQLKAMTESVTDLNKTMAVVVNNQEWHYKELLKHDNRISALEKPNQ